MIDGKAKHSPTNDWDTNAVWVDAGRSQRKKDFTKKILGLALTQVHHWSRLSDSREDGEALSSAAKRI